MPLKAPDSFHVAEVRRLALVWARVIVARWHALVSVFCKKEE